MHVPPNVKSLVAVNKGLQATHQQNPPVFVDNVWTRHGSVYPQSVT